MSKVLLTEILEIVQDCQLFLTSDLQREHLSPETEVRKLQLEQTVGDIINKIRSTHVSIRPRLVTPSSAWTPGGERSSKPPAPLPPPSPLEEDQGGQDEYIDCAPSPLPEAQDYLQFTHQLEDTPQETYVEMANTDEPQDLYSEPVQGTLSPDSQEAEEEIQSTYEEPVLSPALSQMATPSPTPPPSAENSGSGAVYMQTGVNIAPQASSNEATVWEYDVTAPKPEKMKASQLKNVQCRGNLEKLGGKNKKTWQVRYCVLAGPFMYFYEKENSKTYRNRIVILSYSPEEAPEHTNPKKRHFAFKLTHTDESGKRKDYLFRSVKKESCDTWLQSIEDTKCQAQSTSPRMAGSHSAITLLHPTPGSRQAMSPPLWPHSTSLAEEGQLNFNDQQQDTYEEVCAVEELSDKASEGSGSYEHVDPDQQELEREQDQDEYVDVTTSQLENEDQEQYEAPFDLQDSFSPPPNSFTASPAPPPPCTPPPPSHRPDPHVDLNKIYERAPNGINLHNVYVGLWDFTAAEGDEMTVQRGDLVHVQNPDPTAQWWAGEGLNGAASGKTGLSGFFPAAYVMAAFTEVSE